MDSTSDVTGAPNYIVATGGDTTITNGDFKIHAFTSDGTLCVSNAGNPCGSSVLEYLVIAGGGSGGLGDGGGGGAGGFRYFSALSPAGSPLVAPAGISASVASFPITIGGGGAPIPGAPARGNLGSSSIFSTITSAGGGGGGGNLQPKTSVQDGGSGGGGVAGYGAGCGNTPPTAPPQGQNGTSGPSQGGGGGGAGGVGGPSPGTTGGKGGVGSYLPDTFFGPTAPSYGTGGPVPATRYFSGGGGGHGDSAPGPVPDGGGGGRGTNPAPATAGTANTGGGGGGGQPGASGAGGSGVVFIRYKFQN